MMNVLRILQTLGLLIKLLADGSYQRYLEQGGVGTFQSFFLNI